MKPLKNLIAAALVTMPALSFAQTFQPSSIPNWRPYDQNGVNVFEVPKENNITFNDITVRFGAGFAESFQALKHENTPFKDASGVVKNPLYRLNSGFSIAQANLFMDVMLSDGVLLNVTTYLSARHHNEAWVKGGFIQLDKLPLKGATGDKLNELFKNMRLKVGHMEINYGDQHYRRSDGGHTLYNPFIENYILDAFATEVAGELYYMKNNVTVMGGLSNGLINGGYQNATYAVNPANAADSVWKRGISIYGKLAYDNIAQAKNTKGMRYRVSGSLYHNNQDGRSTLFAGDRTGSNYFFVMEAPTANAKDNPFSGRYNNLSFTNQVTALAANALVQASGVELFANYDMGMGRTMGEKFAGKDKRNFNQLAIDAIYRIPSQKVFFGVRYNTLKGKLIAMNDQDKQSINRFAVGGGWFVTKNILMKGEYVTQQYKDFPASSIFSGGKFSGVVLQAAVGF